jgi:hypothetical protein
MIKTSLIALLTVAAVSGAVAPAYATAYSLVQDTDSSAQYFSRTDILARLHENGVNATSVEEWNGLIRAFVRQDDGREVQQFFTQGNLAPVTL